MSIALTPPWECWRQKSAECRDVASYRRRLGRFADELSELFPPKDLSGRHRRSLTEEWLPLRIKVTRTKLAASGGCVMRAGVADVYVNEDEPIQRIRYTVAHELGHLLIDVDEVARELGIEGDAEESLCDVFASRVLIGRAHLRRCVEGAGRLSPSDFLELCRRFRVSLSAMANALGEVWRPGWGVLVVGRQDTEGAGHYRVSAAAYERPWFVPKDMTFSRLGMENVEAWMLDQGGGERSSGVIEKVSVLLWDPGNDERRSGRALIRGDFEALRLRNGGVLVTLTWGRGDATMHWYERARSGGEADERD